MQVDIYEAKARLSKLLAQAKEGEEIIIAEAGKPIARLVSVVERPTRRVAGSAKDRINIAPDFDAPLPESVLKAFER
ncbi:MAG: type II toxin-antitoxin system prevent-host-death family antitoxin [Candidatus Aerophobetes bacterium]|nr:type II toxin-antitoxin system prevent-host-death family antitoxin [Candidatus Aerophobetes bacterium]